MEIKLAMRDGSRITVIGMQNVPGNFIQMSLKILSKKKGGKHQVIQLFFVCLRSLI